MASEMTVALISGGLALGGTFLGALGAIVGSLLTPWVSWGVEKRRRRQDARVELIRQWRSVIRDLRNAEKNNGDIPEAGLMFYEPLRRLRIEIERSSWAITNLDNLCAQPVQDRKGQVPDFLEDQVLRIERKWGLPESPV